MVWFWFWVQIPSQNRADMGRKQKRDTHSLRYKYSYRIAPLRPQSAAWSLSRSRQQSVSTHKSSFPTSEAVGRAVYPACGPQRSSSPGKQSGGRSHSSCSSRKPPGRYLPGSSTGRTARTPRSCTPLAHPEASPRARRTYLGRGCRRYQLPMN